MIEAYYVDLERGQDDQVGLYTQGQEQAVREFYWQLQQAGFRCVPCQTSNRPEYNHFAYISRQDGAPDKPEIAEQLRELCEEHCKHPVGAQEAPGYEAWRVAFNAYVQAYRGQRFDRPDPGVSDAFDKARAYALIEAGRYEEAETYLGRFAFENDAPPALIPIYLVYLYHAWECPAEVAALHTRYEGLLRAADLDHRVVTWIAEAYLVQGLPERARVVIDEFLPEFQRQGVAEGLLALRARAVGG